MTDTNTTEPVEPAAEPTSEPGGEQSNEALRAEVDGLRAKIREQEQVQAAAQATTDAEFQRNQLIHERDMLQAQLAAMSPPPVAEAAAPEGESVELPAAEPGPAQEVASEAADLTGSSTETPEE